MSDFSPKNVPQLSVHPTHLDFGTITSEDPSSAEIMLQVTNAGTGVLVGKVIPQVTWLTVTPAEFRCLEGQTSEHACRPTTRLPMSALQDTYTYNTLLVLNSNGGTRALGGKYRLRRSARQGVRMRLPSWAILVLPVLLVVLFSLLLITNLSSFQARRNQQEQVSLYLTQGAQTIFAAESEALASTLPPPQRETTGAEPVSVLIPTVMTPQTGETAGAPETSSATLTPWPRGEFQNPEQFIRDYYGLINEREYRKAWNLLTTNFQENCCNQFGSEPYNTYVNWWNEIENVEVVSAYLQAWDVNPAPVVVTLVYTYTQGYTAEDSRVFYLVSDEILNTLLIDEVQ